MRPPQHVEGGEIRATGRVVSDLPWWAMHPNEDNVAFDLRARRAERGHEDRDFPADTKDRTIAELKSQVILLRRELARRDDVLMFLAGMARPGSGDAQEMRDEEQRSGVSPEGPQTSARRETRDGTRRRRGARGEDEQPEWPPLPEGYRVVATASDAWVLVARGARVAGYRGFLDREETAREAWEHHRRNG